MACGANCKNPINKNMKDIDLTNLLENYFPEDDEHNKQELSDTRRPRLTLRHLNKLRKIQELKKLEMNAHADFVKTMYGTPDEGGEPEF